MEYSVTGNTSDFGSEDSRFESQYSSVGKKYALHSGWIRSRYDSDDHYIPAYKLIRLYQLKKSQYIIWPELGSNGMIWNDFIHLWPRIDGNYNLPNN